MEKQKENVHLNVNRIGLPRKEDWELNHNTGN